MCEGVLIIIKDVFVIVDYVTNLYSLKYKKKNNSMALNKDDSNEEPIADVMAIQITLPINTCLLTIAYRITVKLLSV